MPNIDKTVSHPQRFWRIQGKKEKFQHIWPFFTSCCVSVCLLAEERGSNSRLKMLIATRFPNKIVLMCRIAKIQTGVRDWLDDSTRKAPPISLQIAKRVICEGQCSTQHSLYIRSLFLRRCQSQLWGAPGCAATWAGKGRAQPPGLGGTYPERERAPCKVLSSGHAPRGRAIGRHQLWQGNGPQHPKQSSVPMEISGFLTVPV